MRFIQIRLGSALRCIRRNVSRVQSPYGIAGPRGVEPRVVKTLHDGFKKALDDPEHLKVLDQLDQEPWYQSSEDYARETLQKERALIERLGLLAK